MYRANRISAFATYEIGSGRQAPRAVQPLTFIASTSSCVLCDSAKSKLSLLPGLCGSVSSLAGATTLDDRRGMKLDHSRSRCSIIACTWSCTCEPRLPHRGAQARQCTLKGRTAPPFPGALGVLRFFAAAALACGVPDNCCALRAFQASTFALNLANFSSSKRSSAVASVSGREAPVRGAAVGGKPEDDVLKRGDGSSACAATAAGCCFVFMTLGGAPDPPPPSRPLFPGNASSAISAGKGGLGSYSEGALVPSGASVKLEHRHRPTGAAAGGRRPAATPA
jgi:hypothetical protein